MQEAISLIKEMLVDLKAWDDAFGCTSKETHALVIKATEFLNKQEGSNVREA